MRFPRMMMAAVLALACGLAQAETATAVRQTELKDKPFSDAKTLASVPAQSKVEIVKRQGSWSQVKAGGKTGWVKMLSLRVEGGSAKAGDSGLKSLFSVASTGRSGSTMTTGVRGLSEEKLHNPQPNPQALQELNGYGVDKGEAQKFAAAGKLKAANMAYLPK